MKLCKVLVDATKEESLLNQTTSMVNSRNLLLWRLLYWLDDTTRIVFWKVWKLLVKWENEE